MHSRTGQLALWAEQHPTWAFPILYLGWAYLCWIPIWLFPGSVWQWPNLFWFLLGGASPLLAGLLLAWLEGGTAQLKDLARRLLDVRRIRWAWWPVLLLFWLAFDLLMAGLFAALGVIDDPLNIRWELAWQPGPLLFLLLLSFVFPAVEEVGLRGYYLDKLVLQFPPGIAALINGLVWALWHAPFLWFPGYYANTQFQPEFWWWMPAIVCHTLLLAWIYFATQRSILAVLVFHAMMNFTGEWLGLDPALHPLMLIGDMLLAGAILFWWRRSGRVSLAP